MTREAVSGRTFEIPRNYYDGYPVWFPDDLNPKALNMANYKNLSVAECQAAVDSPILHRYTNMIIVTNVTHAQNSTLFANMRRGVLSDHYSPHSGPFTATSNLANVSKVDPSTGRIIFDAKGVYCLAEEAHTHCSILLHPGMLLSVILCAGVKLTCLIIIFRQRGYCPITTIGDAVASFMANPEARTRDYGPVTEGDVLDKAVSRCTVRATSTLHRLAAPPPLSFSRLWFRGASLKRWIFTYYM